MHRLLTQMTAAFSMIAAFAVVAPDANAGHQTPIECAADRYRDAVVEFERTVIRARYISHCDRRLVDDLEDSTSRLRSAARDCRRLDRLFARFADTDALHCRVERVLFVEGHYPPDPALQSCWSHVTHAYRTLAREIRVLQAGSHPGVGHHHGHRGVPTPFVAKPLVNPDPFYRSDYTPTFRAETFGSRPALDPRRSPIPRSNVVGPRIPVPGGSFGSPHGETLQRGDGAPFPAPRQGASGGDLAAALIGAFLQRAINR